MQARHVDVNILKWRLYVSLQCFLELQLKMLGMFFWDTVYISCRCICSAETNCWVVVMFRSTSSRGSCLMAVLWDQFHSVTTTQWVCECSLLRQLYVPDHHSTDSGMMSSLKMKNKWLLCCHFWPNNENAVFLGIYNEIEKLDYLWSGSPVWGRGTPLPPLSIYFLIFFPFSLSSFFHWHYLFSSFVHPFPFYQNSPTPFPGRRS